MFTERAGTLIDEYGLPVEDPIAWLDDLKAPDAAQQAREWSRDWMGSHWRPDASREWRDRDGFRFTSGEFS